MTDPARGERVAVVGSRAHPNLDIVHAYVRSLPPGTVVVSGGAEGVDRAAEEAAIECGLCVIVCEPVPEIEVMLLEPHDDGAHRHRARPAIAGRDCTIYRNTRIAVLCDRMVVFPDGSKGGCWDAAREAVRFLRPVEIRWASGEVQPFSKSMQRRIEAYRG